MGEREPRPLNRRERLFEALYGYPLRLAEQVISMGCLQPDINEEFVAFHTDRVEAVDQMLKEMGLEQGTLSDQS